MKGKLVDTWIYEYEGIAVGEKIVSTIKVPIKLLIHKEFKDSDSPPLATKNVHFSVTSEHPPLQFEGPDIECLRVAMWDALSNNFKVTWESYYVVEIRPENGYGDGISTGMVFEYRSVEKGTAWDGTLLMRERRYRTDRILPWPGEFNTKDGKTMACIRASESNRKSLQQFGDRIDTLRELLAEFLRPHTIMQTLEAVDNLRLLPVADSAPATAL